MSLGNIDTLVAFALVMLLLSLLVTTLVETINVILNSRGRNLLWGVTEVLESLQVESTRAKQLALKVLTHRTIAPDARGLGRWIEVAARPLLDWISGADTKGAERRPAAAIRVDEFARLTLDVLESQRNQLNDAERVRHDALATKLQDVVNELDRRTAPGGLNAAVTATLQTAATEARAQAAKIEAWFALVMDRTTERFVAHTRAVTIAVAMFLCFAFQIDSLHILDQLSSDPVLRGQLVRASTENLGHLEDVQKTLDKSKSLASDTLRTLELKADPADKQLLAGLDEPLANQMEARAWLKTHVNDAAARERITNEFNSAFEARQRERAVELAATRKEVLAQLDATTLDLFALGGAWLDWSWRRTGGVLMSMLFLSLGAPFWFNTLSKLSNLKPTVARKVDAEEKAQLAATTGDAKTTASNK